MMKTKFLLLCGLLLAGISCKKDKPLTAPQAGLISYFNFDDNLKDQKGYAGDGVPTGNPTFTAGKIGKALSFNGASQYVTFGSNPSQSPTGITISFWMSANTPPMDGFSRNIVYLLDKNSKYGNLEINQNNKISSFIGDQAGSAESSFTPGVWTHVLMTYNGNDNKLFINGVLANTLTGVGDLSGYFSSILIGKNIIARYFQGSIDELYIYNRALNQAEVTQLYNLK